MAVVRVNAALYSNSAIALRKAAIAGLGLALVPRYAVADDLATGQLVTVLPRNRVPSRTLFAPSTRAAAQLDQKYASLSTSLPNGC